MAEHFAPFRSNLLLPSLKNALFLFLLLSFFFFLFPFIYLFYFLCMQLPCTKQWDAAELSRCRTSWGGPAVPKGPCSPPDPPLADMGQPVGKRWEMAECHG